jgi:hypothetical protein
VVPIFKKENSRANSMFQTRGTIFVMENLENFHVSDATGEENGQLLV